MAKVYVGTYKKYNEGNLGGAWLDLTNYKSYDEFLAACAKVHKDERDPEFMLQDTEDFPDGLSCMEWLSEQDFNDVKQAIQEDGQEVNTPAIRIVDYSEKAFAVIGETKPVKDDLKKLGGRFNGKLSCGAGWIFSNKSREAVEKFISSGSISKTSKVSTSSEGKQFTEWLAEYKQNGGDEYDAKHSIGAVKLHDTYYLIDKPSIDNKFCFHDEGPQYEFYKELTSSDDRLARYFKSENLSSFDNKIERITKGDKYSHDKRIWWYIGKYDKRLHLEFDESYWGKEERTLCNEEEISLILKGLQFGRSQFEKRLDSYLKRYGVSKIHTWTYWADA